MSEQVRSSSRDPYAALRYPEFRNLVIATFLLVSALLIQEIVIGYELYRITHDPLALGLVGLVEAVPFISFSLFGGHTADRYSKRKILLWSAMAIAFCSLLLSFTAHWNAGHQLPKTLFLLVVYGVIFSIGLSRAFHSPTATSLRAFLVPPALYENAATWSSSAWQSGAIIGPALSGFLYSSLGFSNTLLLVSILIGAVFLLYTRIHDKPVQKAAQDTSLIESMKEGFRFVFRKKIIFYSISLDLFSVMFGGVVAILPIYAEDILHVGAEGLGILRAAPSIGAVLMLVVLSRLSPMGHAWRNLLLAILGFGISILVFAVSPWMALSVAALFLSGAFDSISVVIRATLLQVLTPEELRGRVMAVNGMFLASSNELGAFESGLAARIMGTVPSAIFGGTMTLAILGWVYLRSKELMKITELRNAD